MACNAVGRHGITGEVFWGGSGIWAPSGIRLVQASHFNEELLVVHNLDIRGGRQQELDEFGHEFHFRPVSPPSGDGRAALELSDCPAAAASVVRLQGSTVPATPISRRRS